MKALSYSGPFLAGVFVALLVFAQAGNLWAPPCIGCLNSSIQQCYEGLKSPDFKVINPRGAQSFSLHRDQLTARIASIIELNAASQGRNRRSLETTLQAIRNQYDLLDDTVSRNIESGQWILTPQAETILDECYDSLHPEAPDVE